MPSNKTILISFPTNTDGTLTHQIQNLAEDLLRAIEETGHGDMGGYETIDRASSHLTIHVHKTREIGTINKLVVKALRLHLLDERAVVTRLAEKTARKRNFQYQILTLNF